MMLSSTTQRYNTLLAGSRLGRRQGGMALIAVVFAMVVLGLAIAVLARMNARAGVGVSLDVKQARAEQAARAGLEWAAYQVRDPQGTLFPGPTNLPLCFASPRSLSLPPPLDAYSVSVSCSRSPAAPDFHLEDQRRIVVFSMVAVAEHLGTSGTAEHVIRRQELRIEACKDPSSPAPLHRC